MTLRSLGILAAFLLAAAAGCGDDDDKSDGTGTSGHGGGGGSSGSSALAGAGSTAGSGGASAGSGGASAGSGGAGAGSGGASAGSGSTGPTMSGVAGSTRLDALSDGDKQKLCAWGAALPGLGMEKECPDGSTVEASVDTGQDCIDALDVSSCAATVAQYEACIEAQLANPCEFFVSACDPIFACMQ